MEILAPAGNFESFWAAVEKKADAVYVGWKDFNARVQAENFSLKDLSYIIPFAHSRGVKVYLAFNTLLKEAELPEIIDGLKALEQLRPDALIIQDLGLFYLIRKHFPGLRLHGSTLMTVCNHLGAAQLNDLGFRRVVLARELSLNEISSIQKQSSIELELFVQGALCYTYSGLCLMSSYFGGKSSTRGRCVQPCRRAYWNGKKWGNFFSMNDLCALELVPQLKKMGISSVKIEGRMRSAHYVATVVEAYRLVIDGSEGNEETMARAGELLKTCLGRKSTRGYFFFPRTEDVITPHLSGTAGLFLGKITGTRGDQAMITLAADVSIGDRLRLVRERDDTRPTFTMKRIFAHGKGLESASRGEEVVLGIPEVCGKGDLLFKIDSKSHSEIRGARRIMETIAASTKPVKLRPPVKGDQRDVQISRLLARRSGIARKKRLEFWIKLPDLDCLARAREIKVDKILVPLNQCTFAQYERGRKRFLRFKDQLVWMLPPVIEENKCSFYETGTKELSRAGFRSWYLGHVSQARLFSGKRDVNLSAGYTCNILNSLSARSVRELGIERLEFSIETDFENLEKALSHLLDFQIGLTVYGRPPLFTSRLEPPGLGRNPVLRTGQKEFFSVAREEGLTLIRSVRDFSLLPHLKDLQKAGLTFVVIDLTWANPKGSMISDCLAGQLPKEEKGRTDTFNFLGKLA